MDKLGFVFRERHLGLESGGQMAIKKKYEDQITVGGTQTDNLELGIKSLEVAGFKKVRRESPLFRIAGDWKPLIGTLYGEITVDFQQQGSNTLVSITIVANVDNAYALVSSPGERIKAKFLEEFLKLSTQPGQEEIDDIPTKLAKLSDLMANGVITQQEYEQARLNIISGI